MSTIMAVVLVGFIRYAMDAAALHGSTVAVTGR
jgi:hypothetical protein